MENIDFKNISVEPLSFQWLAKKEIDADVLRLDKIHQQISGNKWFKLRFYISEAIAQQKKTIVTFGGAWSNHILATAAVASLHGMQSAGIIRGETPATVSSTLIAAQALGMKILFTPREDYRQKIIPPELLKDDHYLVPEGGYGEAGVKGAATLFDYCDVKQYSHVCAAVGTGTMIAGISTRLTPDQKLIGISAMKNNFEIEESIHNLLSSSPFNLAVNHDYHFGGYAKHTSTLIHFMNDLYEHSSIPTDFVYTGKLFYGVNDLAKQDFFPQGSKILLIHSGGLQGNNSFGKGTLKF